MRGTVTVDKVTLCFGRAKVQERAVGAHDVGMLLGPDLFARDLYDDVGIADHLQRKNIVSSSRADMISFSPPIWGRHFFVSGKQT
jgi:hypothetical protein